jgi:hypothetical protein
MRIPDTGICLPRVRRDAAGYASLPVQHTCSHLAVRGQLAEVQGLSVPAAILGVQVIQVRDNGEAILLEEDVPIAVHQVRLILVGEVLDALEVMLRAPGDH